MMSLTPSWLQNWETWANIFQSIATPILIAIGGVFAWCKFIRQGKHDSRLQPSVTSEVVVREGVAYIIANVGVLNTGQVDVVLNLEESGLLIEGREAGSGWKKPATIYSVFPGQQKVRSGEATVQPGETLEDQIWIEFEYKNDVAACLELTIAEKDGLTWHTVEMISLLDGGKTTLDG